MRVCASRLLLAAAVCLGLGACETSTKFADLFPSRSGDVLGARPEEPPATGTVSEVRTEPTSPPLSPPPAKPAPASSPKPLGSDPNDDLSLGKKYYRSANYGLAERYFRRAVEVQANDAEAWVGLAAAYDRLRKFELADRAYKRAQEILGPTPELLNNRGYSYILRGDYRRARTTLAEAAAKDPDSPYIKNNLELLDKSLKGKGID
jgi:tetratricopeptide (TPR) repeat protein